MRVLRMGNNDVTGAGGGRNMLHRGHIETSHNKLVSRNETLKGTYHHFGERIKPMDNKPLHETCIFPHGEINF